jgi:hypothetical protein
MAPALSPSVNLVAGDSETHSTLSRGESIGLAFDTEAGLCSALAASVILAIIFVSFRCLDNIFTLNLVLAQSVQEAVAVGSNTDICGMFQSMPSYSKRGTKNIFRSIYSVPRLSTVWVTPYL